jgi:Spy/CpxP family protein refolding chaperone
MKNKVMISLLTASLAMNIGVAAMFGQKIFQAKAVTNERYCPFSTNDNPLYNLLNLSSDQLGSIKSIAGDFHQTIARLSNEVQEKRSVMLSLMEKDGVDMNQIEIVRHDIGSLQSQIQQIVFEHILQMKKLLTSEQRKVFFQAMRQSFPRQSQNCSQ